MALTKSIPVGELTVTVKEMTVGEIRDWLKRARGEKLADRVDLVDEHLHRDMPLTWLQDMTDLSRTHLDQLTQSEVDKLIGVCKELNPHFFHLVGQILVRVDT